MDSRQGILQVFDKVRVSLCVGALALAMFGCGPTDEPVQEQKLHVDVYGWGPGDETAPGDDFFKGIPRYEDASTVRVMVSLPGDNRVVATESASIASRQLKLPEIPYGERLRIDLEVVNLLGDVLASGATNIFDVTSKQAPQIMRLVVSPIDDFSPVGAVSKSSATGENVFAESKLDYRAEIQRSTSPWLGRVGHATAVTSDGQVVIVGGTSNLLPASLDSDITLSAVHGDVQVYDPRTGYFTDLSFEDATQRPFENRADFLSTPRAFHTLTPLGNDKFLVTGGYTVRTLPDGSKQTRPALDIELIDLSAEPGQRVGLFYDASGAIALQLKQPRAFHEAIYLQENGQLLLIGGRGQAPGSDQSSDVPLANVEVIDVAEQRVVGQLFELGVARTDHRAVALGDGTIWVMGGRNKEGVLASTQFLELSTTGISTSAGPDLKLGRYGFGLQRISGRNDTNVLVVGGYTNAAGAVSDTVELGIKGVGFTPLTGQKLTRGRGGLTLLTLPQTQDVLVFGGRDAMGAPANATERLQFNGLAESPPYEVMAGSFGSFTTSRYDASYSMMPNGRVLVVGGIHTDGAGKVSALDGAEQYNPRDPVGSLR